MKKFLLFLLTALASTAFAGDVNFQSMTWNDLRAKAKAEGKYLFVDGMTDWCIWCKVMDKKTFTDDKVAKVMNHDFVSTRIDMEKGEGIALAMKYRITGFPTFLIFSPDGRLVYRLGGYREANDFLQDLEAARDAGKQQSYAGITEGMDLPYPEFYRKTYASGKKKREYPDDATVASFFKDHKDWKDEVSFGVIMRYATPDDVNRYFLDNLETYRKLYGVEPDEKVIKLIYAKADAAAKDKSESGISEALAMTDKYLPGENSELKRSLSMQYYGQTGDWSRYAATLQQDLDANGYDDVELINACAWNIYEHCDDKAVIDGAVKWMSAATKKDPQYAYLDTYAALLYKSGNLTDAERVARQAIDTGKHESQDVSETEALLLKIQASTKR